MYKRCVVLNYILLIDDEESIRELLKDFLSILGYRVHVANDGREGIRLLNGYLKYDAVLTDIGMPGIDGNEVARHVRGSENPHMPVLAITGLHESHLQTDLFDMIIQKPFNLKKIQTALRALIQRDNYQ